MDENISCGIEPELDRRHQNTATFFANQDFAKLEQDLETPTLIYFLDEGEIRQNSSSSCCLILWLRWKQSGVVKMWCGTGCGRLCLILLFVKLLILAVLLPVVHLQSDHNGHSNQGYDFPSHGYGDPTLEAGNYGSIGHENGGPPDYSESGHVQPPLAEGDDNNDNTGNNQNGDATTRSDGDVGVEPGPGDNGSQDDLIVVVRHENEQTFQAVETPSPSSDSEDAAKTSSTGLNEEAKICTQSADASANPLESKLESIISAISNIHQSIEKMETLMQGTLMDDQRAKTISAIHSGNTSLALKHWTHILKYLKSTKTEEALTTLIKEAYNGVPEVISPLSDFLQATSLCSGFSTLYSEMLNYGHVFGGHPYIFPLALKLRETKSCPNDLDNGHKLPAAVTSLLSGSFTLQNKGNQGYLYYAKRCVARHYYHCLDVLTKRVAGDEFTALEKESEEWRRYRWRINSTNSANSIYFLVLNEDRYLPYRLQDLNNSPRFKMEEASSNFEADMAHFQFGLENEDQVVIQVRDTNMFLEGEDGTGEILLNSFHKTEKTPGLDNSRIRWLVGGEISDGKLRVGRASERNSGKFPLWMRKSVE